MMSLIREPFWKEYVLVIALTVIVGAGCAAGTARALDAALGEATHSLLGEAGQYDLIVHVRQDYREAAGRELQRLLVGRDPEIRVVPGVTVAGNANFLVKLPDRLFSQDVLEDVAARLKDVPGFNGYTWLLEPSVSVSGLQPALRDLVAREAASLPGVRAAVRGGSSVTVVLAHIEHREQVMSALRELVERRQVVEVRLPDEGAWEPGQPAAAATDAAAGNAVEAVRAALAPLVIAELTPEKPGTGSSVTALRGLLASLATRVRVALSPETALEIGDRLVLQGPAPSPPVPGEPPGPQHLVVEVVERSGGEALAWIVQGDAGQGTVQTAFRLVDGAVGPPAGQAVLESPRWALAQGLAGDGPAGPELAQLAQIARETADRLGELTALVAPESAQAAVEQRAERLARALRSGDGATAVRETLLGVALSVLARKLQTEVAGGAGAVDGAGANASVDGGAATGAGLALRFDAAQLKQLRQSLMSLADAAEALQGGAAGELLAGLVDVQQLAGSLRDDEITGLLRIVDGVAGSQGAEPRLVFLVDDRVSATDVEEAIRRATGRDATVIAARAGVVNPSARSLLVELLTDVRRSIAGIVAVLVAGAALVLDHATVLAALRRLEVRPAMANAFGAVLGAVLLAGAWCLSGAELPFLGPAGAVAAGAALGLATALLADRLSPVRTEEIVAGQSLGLTNGQIMREIVVPAGRPGLLSLVNRWRREFR
ncbi:MAG TPA: hypothetical protein VIK98_00290 [Limnochordales bacterium]